MKNNFDSDALRAIIWQALVDRANGRTHDTIRPEDLELREKDRRSVSRDDQRPAIDPAKEIIERILNKSAADAKSPSDSDLRRMYDVVQADARLSSQLEGLGFGRTGNAYRNAAIKLRIMSLMNLLRDGKNIRNDIVHKPGYVPSEQSSARALMEYSQAADDLQRYLNAKKNPAV